MKVILSTARQGTSSHSDERYPQKCYEDTAAARVIVAGSCTVRLVAVACLDVYVCVMIQLCRSYQRGQNSL